MSRGLRALGLLGLLSPTACFISTETEDEDPADAAPRLDAVAPGHTGLLLNEVSAGEDYIELFNPSADVDLTGLALVDGGYEASDPTTHTGHRLVLSGSLAFGARLVLPEVPFRVGDADIVRLLDPTGAELDRVQWNAGAAEVALCRLPDGAGAFGPCAQSPGEANLGLPPPSTRALPLVINEVASSGEDPIELRNHGAEPIDLAGFSLADQSALSADGYALTGTIASGGARMVPKAQHGLGLGTRDTVYLLDPEGGVVDQTTWSDGAAFVSWCRIPDGTGEFQACSVLTLNEPNLP